MKKKILLVVLLVGGLISGAATAQVQARFKVNIGVQPVWGLVGYDHVEYYYFPDIDVYYYVPARQYIYQERGRWMSGSFLPLRFHDYDVYRGYKAVINEPKPYLHADNYRRMFAPYKGRRNQAIIRNSHEPKYFEIREHPEHNKWKNNDGREQNGRGN